MNDWDEIEEFGHMLVGVCSVGALIYIAVAALWGWL